MSAARQDGSDHPSSSLSEWSSKVRNLQGLIDHDDAEERAKLEREIEESRLERARRRGKSIDLTTPESAGTAEPRKPTGSSFQVPMPNTPAAAFSSEKPPPMSLAAFMGGKATGPRLTKVPKTENVPTIDGLDYDPRPYANRVSPLAQVARGAGGPIQSPHTSKRWVAMPGMRPEQDESNSRSPQISSTAVTPADTPRSTPAVSPGLPTPSRSNTASSLSPGIPSTNKSIAERTRQLSEARSSSTSSPSSVPASPAIVTPSPKPSLPMNKPTSPPVASSARFDPSAEASPKPLTPSLTRLQGRGLVGERVKAAETPSGTIDEEIEITPEVVARSVSGPGAEPAPAKATDAEKPVNLRRRSIVDRWPLAAAASSSPTMDKFAAPATSTTSSAPRELKSTTSFERSRSVALDPPKPPSPSGVAPPSPSFAPKPSQLRGAQMDRPSPTPASSVSSTTVPKPAASTPFSRPSPASTPVNQDVTSTATLAHPTRDRARKPKREGSSTTPSAAKPSEAKPLPEPTLERKTSSRLSDPPTFRRLVSSDPKSEETAPTVASIASSRFSNDVDSMTSRSQILSPPPTAPSMSSSIRESSTPVISALSTTSPPPVRGSNVSRLMDSWGSQAPIGVKSVAPAARTKSPEVATPVSAFAASRRALPGMAKEPVASSSPVQTPSWVKQQREAEPEPVAAAKIPPAGGRRSPSPGPRPTAMELAAALNLVDSPAPIMASSSPTPATTLDPPVPRPLARRKSSYGYSQTQSGSSLPPVEEVDTPPPSLTRAVGREVAASGGGTGSLGPKFTTGLGMGTTTKVLKHDDKPLPAVNVKDLLSKAASPPALSFDPSLKPISTDVMSIRGRSASPVAHQPHIFYESELRAIVYRSKDTSTGLASTTIWSWKGSSARIGPDEDWKLRDLESRFGTKVIPTEQGSEPLELISLLGGEIALRQGSASAWSAENTAMHVVRSAAHGSNVVITELDMHVRNLCSAYSYVITVLGSIYVWHGRGSLPNEQSHALSYASSLSGEKIPVTTFNEGEEDPMFWAYLGDEGWANADYWAERRDQLDGRVRSCAWKVDASSRTPAEITILNTSSVSQNVVYLIDGIFEVFVIVGSQARGERASIRLALTIAQDISKHVAEARPFSPPIHVVILPSLLPSDLRAGHLGITDEIAFSGGIETYHMNVLEVTDGLSQLSQTSWKPEKLEDPDFLPLGIAPSML